MSALPRMTLVIPTGLIYDKRKVGWALLKEGPQVEGEPVLDFLSFLREGESYINGDTVLARAGEMDGTESGQHHLERMLWVQDQIPAELRPYYLVATGTKWLRRDGHLCVPCLEWGGGGWVLAFGGVADDHWSDVVRVVRVFNQPRTYSPHIMKQD